MTISSVGATTNSYPTSSTDGFTQLFNDFKSIASDIQSGDLTTAQSALSTFESDLQSNGGQNPLSQLFSNNSTLGTDLQNLQTALQSNNSSSAQSAFQTLIQDMQTAMQTHGTHRHHRHHHVNNDGDSDDQAFGSTGTTAGSDTDSDSGTASATVGSTLNVQA
ncbi:MAG TPA: hypothetical protein VMA13_09500 [Candidatus Saccharimonadales bacterium]|nr:hypothetical protein [Candidatus Saccharimonadales bacterium]